MKSFIDGIHYELSELIDTPFTLGLEPIIKRAYELNPKDYIISSSVFNNFNGTTSLKSLFSNLANDFESKLLLAFKATQFSFYEPSQEFKNTIKNAKFWQRDFEKA